MTNRATAPDAFTLDSGRRLELDPNHRASVRAPSATGYGDESLVDEGLAGVASWLERVDARVELAARTLALFGWVVDGARVLVVGASEGGEVACLIRRGARSVVGTDYGDVFEGDGRIGARRERVMRTLGEHAARATFEIDDIAGSQLETGSFDLVLSWQTLEHVADPAGAMREMARLLPPGGLAFHEYNPFFAIDGGHSLCTLEAPWGHARVTPAEFARYVRERRPEEAAEAERFFTGALNRMTLADLDDHVRGAGLTRETLLPRTRTEDLMALTPEILEDVRRLYPRAGVTDLISRVVRVVARR